MLTWGLVIREFSHPPQHPCQRGRWVSASVAVARIGIPVHANSVYDRARSATNETKDGVGVQGNSVETCARVSSKRQVAAFVCHEDQLLHIRFVPARHLDHRFPGVQKDLLQVTLCATYIVTPHCAIAHLQAGGRGEKRRNTLDVIIEIQDQAAEMAQLVEMLAAKPDNLSLTPRTCMWRERTPLPLASTCTMGHLSTHTHGTPTHTHTI